MTKENKNNIAEEVARTFELYGFEMSFTEFKDIFELGAQFGYQLALIDVNKTSKNENSLVFNSQRPVLKSADLQYSKHR